MNLVNLDNNTFGIAVPIEAYDINVWNHGIGFRHDGIEQKDDSNGFNHLDKETELFKYKNFEILGIASLTEITFDCEPYVEKKDCVVFGDFGCLDVEMFRNYNLDDTYWKAECDQYTNKQKSFLSLLISKGLMPTEETKILILKQK